MKLYNIFILSAIVWLLIFGGCTSSVKTPFIKKEITSPASVAPSQAVADSEQPFVPDAPPLLQNSDNTENTDEQPEETLPDIDRALDLCEAAQNFWQEGDLESALHALDQAYALIIDIDTNDIPKLIQQKEDLRFLISKRILEIYASRNTVVNGHHTAIPMTINEHIQKEIDRFVKGPDRSFFIASYKRSGLYRPYITENLKAAGLPETLSWLPLIESGFKTGALSRARALGLWQFIPSTGYKFGLERDTYIDERLDPIKSTQAAIAYLKELHQIFGDWTTVLAAYNCGEGRVLRIIRSQNVNYLDNFWDLYERLPRETARYVPRFLATLHIINNLEKYGMESIAVEPPLTFDTVTINRQVSLANIAKVISTSEKTLSKLNPELRYKILPAESYLLRVPKGLDEARITEIGNLPVSSPPRPAFVYHRVRRGQTLSAIAKRYGTSVQAISRANNINRRHLIVAGQLLKIPLRGSSYRPSHRQRPVVKNATRHVVRRGDSLWIIAKRYGTTTTEIQKLNHLKSTNLVIGQVLKLPGYHSKRNLKVYKVKPGDSPYSIATKHNMDLEDLLTINRLTKYNKIYPGQSLYVE